MEASKTIQNIQEIYQYLPKVQIDRSSKFKYIYISCYLKPDKKKKTVFTAKDSVYFVRGFQKFPFHADIFDDFIKKFNDLDLFLENPDLENPAKTQIKPLKSLVKIEVYGGGWLEWDLSGKKLDVFGESQRYGPANHQKTREVLLKELKEIKNEDVTYEELEF